MSGAVSVGQNLAHHRLRLGLHSVGIVLNPVTATGSLPWQVMLLAAGNTFNAIFSVVGQFLPILVFALPIIYFVQLRRAYRLCRSTPSRIAVSVGGVINLCLGVVSWYFILLVVMMQAFAFNPGF